MPNLKELERWTDAAGAARELGISTQGVHKRLQSGMFPGPVVRTAGGWIVSPEAVEKARAQREARHG